MRDLHIRSKDVQAVSSQQFIIDNQHMHGLSPSGLLTGWKQNLDLEDTVFGACAESGLDIM